MPAPSTSSPQFIRTHLRNSSEREKHFPLRVQKSFHDRELSKAFHEGRVQRMSVSPYPKGEVDSQGLLACGNVCRSSRGRAEDPACLLTSRLQPKPGEDWAGAGQR